MQPNIFCGKVHGIYVPLHHVQTKSEFLLTSLAFMCCACMSSKCLTCSRKGQSCWWSCYGRLGPCRVRTQGFECRHPAPCWLEAGFSGRAPVRTHRQKKYVSKCEIHKVSRLGLQERKLNRRQNKKNSLELLQVQR